VSLSWERRDREGIAIFDLKGRIVMGQEASEFREAVAPLANAQEGRIILNMMDVAYIDSTGLGALVLLAGVARKSKSQIRLLSMNARNLELLVTTKLETIFENFHDEQDAVNSFFPDRAVKKFDILAFVKEQQDK
jgi:anti-sigma B factor antagonist